MELRNVVGNVTHLTMMAICGVQVPVSFWPQGIEFAAAVLPLTQAAWELLVGAGWLALEFGD